jgi:hypothetical protein
MDPMPLNSAQFANFEGRVHRRHHQAQREDRSVNLTRVAA